MMENKNVKKIIIVGAGHVLQYHLGAIRRILPGADVHVTDIDPGKANALEIAKFGAKFIPYPKWIAEMERSDLIIICVPCAEHFAVAKKALEAGKNVLLEKPPTKTGVEFKELQKIVERVPGAKLICAFHAAYDLTIQRFAAQMKKDIHPQYGKLIGLRAEFDDPYMEEGRIISNLGGSYEDSAPNALSVVARFIDLSKLRLTGVSMNNDIPAADGIICTDSSARVTYDYLGRNVEVYTDWTRGLNRKVTWLLFEKKMILLDHSKQAIFATNYGYVKGESEMLFNCRNDLSRLDNHYNGVYGDCLKMIADGSDNTGLGLRITELWTGAYKKRK